MSWKLLKLNDGTVPPESPLYGIEEVSVEQEPLWELDGFDLPRTIRVFDPEWEYTDSKGHDHYVNGAEYPTLRAVYEDCGCCLCSDEDYYERLVRYECIGCGEEVRNPGTREEPYRVPARTTVTIYKKVPRGQSLNLIADIEPVAWEMYRSYTDAEYQPTESQWLRIVDAHNEAVREHLGIRNEVPRSHGTVDSATGDR